MSKALVPGAMWIFAFGVAGAIGAASREFSRMPSGQPALFVLLGAGMVLAARVWRSRDIPSQTIYWTTQAMAAALLTWTSRGHGSLALLPVLGESVLWAPRRRVASFAVLAGVLIVAAHRQRATNWAQAATLSAGHLAGVLFVVALAMLLRSERDARAQNEALAGARERTRIARDLHDTLGHALTAAQAQLGGALAVGVADLARMETLIRGATASVEDGLLALRRSVSALREEPSLVFLDAARALFDNAERAGIRTRLHAEGVAVTLPAMVSMVLYRALQECITNTLRHARANRIDAVVYYAPSRVTMTVDDDGRSPRPIVYGAGLRGIEERLMLVGGDLTVSPSATGLTVRVTIAI